MVLGFHSCSDELPHAYRSIAVLPASRVLSRQVMSQLYSVYAEVRTVRGGLAMLHGEDRRLVKEQAPQRNAKAVETSSETGSSLSGTAKLADHQYRSRCRPLHVFAKEII